MDNKNFVVLRRASERARVGATMTHTYTDENKYYLDVLEKTRYDQCDSFVVVAAAKLSLESQFLSY